jgi:hypothetical protein
MVRSNCDKFNDTTPKVPRHLSLNRDLYAGAETNETVGRAALVSPAANDKDAYTAVRKRPGYELPR